MMKKVLLLIVSLVSGISVCMGQYTTTDYMYTEGIKSENGKLFFDVLMKGSTMYYTAFQTEIQLPAGLKITAKRGGAPNVELLKDAETFNDAEGFTEHSVASNFPESGNQTYLKLGGSSDYNYNMAQTSGPLFRVYVEKTDEADTWPIGAIKFFGAKFVTDQAIGYAIADREDVVVVNSGEITLPVSISAAAKWSTCVLPFAAPVPAGVKAYTCSMSDDEYLYLSEAESLEAYKPYVLYAENGYEGNVSGTVEADGCPETGMVTDGYLCGAVVPQTATSGYVLQKHDADVMFYAIGDGDTFTIPAGKCWLKPAATNAKVLKFSIRGIATAVDAAVAPTTTGMVYDVAGRQRQDGDKGLLIKNGKKIFNK